MSAAGILIGMATLLLGMSGGIAMWFSGLDGLDRISLERRLNFERYGRAYNKEKDDEAEARQLAKMGAAGALTFACGAGAIAFLMMILMGAG